MGLQRSNCLYLDLHILGQAGHLHAGARRIHGIVLGEEVVVDLIHRSKVVQIRDKHRGLEDVAHLTACRLDNRLYVLQGAQGLRFDPLHNVAAHRVQRDLTGGV